MTKERPPASWLHRRPSTATAILKISSGAAAFQSHPPFLDTLTGRRYNGGLEPFQGRLRPGGYIRE